MIDPKKEDYFKANVEQNPKDPRSPCVTCGHLVPQGPSSMENTHFAEWL